MPFVHVLFEVFLHKVAIAAILCHEVEHDDAAPVLVQVKPSGLVDQTCFNVRAVQRFKDNVRDGSGFGVGLEQLVHAVEHGEGGEGNGSEHHDGNGKRLPRVLLLEHTPIGLVKQAHTVNWARVVEECSPSNSSVVKKRIIIIIVN